MSDTFVVVLSSYLRSSACTAWWETMNYIVDVSDWKWKQPFLSLFVGAFSGRFMKNSLCKIRDNELYSSLSP